MTYKAVDATVCPKGHEDCQEIAEVDCDMMPDQCQQGWYCYECDRTYVVLYRAVNSHFVELPDDE